MIIKQRFGKTNHTKTPFKHNITVKVLLFRRGGAFFIHVPYSLFQTREHISEMTHTDQYLSREVKQRRRENRNQLKML